MISQSHIESLPCETKVLKPIIPSPNKDSIQISHYKKRRNDFLNNKRRKKVNSQGSKYVLHII